MWCLLYNLTTDKCCRSSRAESPYDSMMGLCKSCFTSKYYGSSPEETSLEPDAQMLLSERCGDSKKTLILSGPGTEKIIDEASVIFFTAEYCIRFLCSPIKLRFFKRLFRHKYESYLRSTKSLDLNGNSKHSTFSVVLKLLITYSVS